MPLPVAGYYAPPLRMPGKESEDINGAGSRQIQQAVLSAISKLEATEYFRKESVLVVFVKGHDFSEEETEYRPTPPNREVTLPLRFYNAGRGTPASYVVDFDE